MRVFEKDEHCSGCGVCVSACPKDAISLIANEKGFVYPVIDEKKCVSCGLCKQVCGYNSPPEFKNSIKSYAVSNKDIEAVKKSASGGAFEVIAKHVIKRGGFVYGVSMEKSEHGITPRHVEISKVEDLEKLQGSKYVQSDAGLIYKLVRKRADEGALILFSGTPCQIAGLKNYLRKDYSNVILLEIICHGVPNAKLFSDFISYYENKNNSTIEQFLFRDKSRGQGYTTKTIYNKNGKRRIKIGKGELTAYIRFFSKSLILRESCYECPFAQIDRVADITVGDFWGYSKEYPVKQNNPLNEKNGVSCLMVNSAKAQVLVDDCFDSLYAHEAELDRIAKHNKQLNAPTEKPKDREIVIDTYVREGYAGLEKLYWRKYPKDKVKYIISLIIPTDFKNGIRRIIK